MLEQIMTVGFVTAFLTASVRMAVPLIYAGLGETISEKAGILNIGMEGVMLGGAFFSFAGTFYSGSLAVGLLCGMAGQRHSRAAVHQAGPGSVCQRNRHQYIYGRSHQFSL